MIIAVGAWFFGWINEMHRTEYNVVVCSSFDEETTEQEYIFENDDKRYIAYVVIGDADDYFLCKRLTNKGTISNIQSFIKKKELSFFRFETISIKLINELKLIIERLVTLEVVIIAN